MELRCTQHFPNTNSQHPSKNAAAAANNSQNLLASVSKLRCVFAFSCFCSFFLSRIMYLNSQQNNWEEVKCDPMKSLSPLTDPRAITQRCSNEVQLEFPRSKLFKQTSWKQTEEQSYQWPLMGFQRFELLNYQAALKSVPCLEEVLTGNVPGEEESAKAQTEIGIIWGVRCSWGWGNTPVLHLLKNDLIFQSIWRLLQGFSSVDKVHNHTFAWCNSPVVLHKPAASVKSSSCFASRHKKEAGLHPVLSCQTQWSQHRHNMFIQH